MRTLLDQITDDGDTPLEVARAIQAHLRGNAFTYSLELADEEASGALPDDAARPVPPDQAWLLHPVQHRP